MTTGRQEVRARLRAVRDHVRDPARRREVLIMAVAGLVVLGILGAGTIALVQSRSEPEAAAPDPTCVRWKITGKARVLYNAELTGVTATGAKCGDPLQLRRIGRQGPFTLSVDDEVLWTSRCPDRRSPRLLQLEAGVDGELRAVVHCPPVYGTTGSGTTAQLNIDALLREQGLPAYLADET